MIPASSTESINWFINPSTGIDIGSSIRHTTPTMSLKRRYPRLTNCLESTLCPLPDSFGLETANPLLESKERELTAQLTFGRIFPAEDDRAFTSSSLSNSSTVITTNSSTVTTTNSPTVIATAVPCVMPKPEALCNSDVSSNEKIIQVSQHKFHLSI